MSASSTPAPVTPRPAATVVLVRETVAAGLEVLLMQRPLTMKFLPGYWAFPGGAVEGADAAAAAMARLLRGPAARPPGADLAPAGLAPAGLTQAGLTQAGAASVRLAPVLTAVREVFEETGVLLAAPAAGGSTLPELAAWREQVRQDAAALAALLEAYDLYVDGDRLRYLHRWVTSPTRPIRFDARFFVAVLPPGQAITPYAAELAAVSWHSPAAALREFGAGRLPMADATEDTLIKLAAYDSIAALIDGLPPASHLVRDDLWTDPPALGVR